MLNRVPVQEETVSTVCAYIKNEVHGQMLGKGPGAFVGDHEALGAITEEYHELVEAVRSNNGRNITHELTDLAAACVFALASRIEETE